MTTDTPAVPSTSDEDVYQRAARAYIDGNPAVSGSNPQAAAPDLAAHGPFRAAVDEARRDLLADNERLRAEVETKTYVAGKNRDHHWQALDELDKRDAELAAARAEIAAQAATITELRAQIERTNGDYDKGWQAGHAVGYQDGHRDGSRI